MTVAQLIESYGYLAVAVGAFLEGETVVFVAGAAAARGHLWLPAVVAAAAAGGFVGDQFYFLLGRRWGARLLARFAWLRSGTARARALLERHHTPLILSIRFLYGLRIAGPLAFGMSSVAWRRFAALNLIGAVAWALAITGIGYGFAHLLVLALGHVRPEELWLLLVLLAGGVLAGLAAWYRRTARARAERPRALR